MQLTDYSILLIAAQGDITWALAPTVETQPLRQAIVRQAADTRYYQFFDGELAPVTPEYWAGYVTGEPMYPTGSQPESFADWLDWVHDEWARQHPGSNYLNQWNGWR